MYNIYTGTPGELVIFIYDRSIKLLSVLEGYQSLTMERSLFGVGRFTLVTTTGITGVEELRIGNIISLGMSDSRAGIIGEVRVDFSGGIETVTVSGYMLKGIAAKRIIVPPTETELPGSYGWESIASTEAENVLRHYFDLSCIHPRDPNRAIPGIVLDDLHSPPRGPVTPWYAEHKEKLTGVLQEIGEWTKVGWDVRLDIANKQLVFVVIPPRERTQGSGTPVMFSRDIGNLNDYTFQQGLIDYSNTVYIGGAGENEEQFVLTAHVDEDGQEVEEPWKSWERMESWVSAGNIDDPEKLLFEGLHKHNARKKLLHSIRAGILDTESFRYGVDWDLGDRVTMLIYPTGQERRLDSQITKIVETYESGPIRYDITLGDELPTLREELYQINSQI